MPPLRGPVDDDLDGYPRDDEPSRRRRWAWIAAGVVLLLAAAGVAWLLLSSGKDPGTGDLGTSTTTHHSVAAGTVYIDTNAFIGKPADAVQAQLQSQGLTVSRQDATTQQMRDLGRSLQAGDVVGSDPANTTVAKGARVTLYVAPRAYTPQGAGGVPATSATTTTQSRPTPTPTPSATTSAAPTSSTAVTTTADTSATPTDTTTAGGTEVSSSAPATTSSVAAGGAGGSP